MDSNLSLLSTPLSSSIMMKSEESNPIENSTNNNNLAYSSSSSTLLHNPKYNYIHQPINIRKIMEAIDRNTELSLPIKEYMYELLITGHFLPEYTDCIQYLSPSSKCTKERNCGVRHNFTLYKLIKEGVIKSYALPHCLAWISTGQCSDGATCINYHPSLEYLPYIQDYANILYNVHQDNFQPLLLTNYTNPNTSINTNYPRDIRSIPMNGQDSANITVFWDTENCSLPWAATVDPNATNAQPQPSTQQQQTIIASGAEVIMALEQILKIVTGFSKVHLTVNAFHRQNLTSTAKTSLQMVGVKLIDCGNKGGAVDTGIFNALIEFVLTKRIERTNLNDNTSDNTIQRATSPIPNQPNSNSRSASPISRPALPNPNLNQQHNEWVVLVSGDRDFRGITSIKDKLNIPTILFHGPSIHKDLHILTDKFIPWSLVTNHANYSKYVKINPNAALPPHVNTSGTLENNHHPDHLAGRGLLNNGSSNSLAKADSGSSAAANTKGHNIPVTLKFKNNRILDPTITFSATRLMKKDYDHYEQTGILPVRIRKACRVCAFFLGQRCLKGDQCGFLHPCPDWDYERMEGCSKGDLCLYDHILPMHNISSPSLSSNQGVSHHHVHHGNTSPIAPHHHTHHQHNFSGSPYDTINASGLPPAPLNNNFNNNKRIPSGPRLDTSFLTRAVTKQTSPSASASVSFTETNESNISPSQSNNENTFVISRSTSNTSYGVSRVSSNNDSIITEDSTNSNTASSISSSIAFPTEPTNESTKFSAESTAVSNPDIISSSPNSPLHRTASNDSNTSDIYHPPSYYHQQQQQQYPRGRLASPPSSQPVVVPNTIKYIMKQQHNQHDTQQNSYHPNELSQQSNSYSVPPPPGMSSNFMNRIHTSEQQSALVGPSFIRNNRKQISPTHNRPLPMSEDNHHHHQQQQPPIEKDFSIFRKDNVPSVPPPLPPTELPTISNPNKVVDTDPSHEEDHQTTNEDSDNDSDDYDLQVMLKQRSPVQSPKGKLPTSPKLTNNTTVPTQPPTSPTVARTLPSTNSYSTTTNISTPDTNNNVPQFKTTMCRHYQRTGYCARGTACGFAHGETELQEQRRLSLLMKTNITNNNNNNPNNFHKYPTAQAHGPLNTSS